MDMDISSVLQRITSKLQSIPTINRIFQKTFSSPSKYIRITSYTSSFLLSWSILRWAYINLKGKLFNYPPCIFAGSPVFGALAYQVISKDVIFSLLYMGNIGPINMMILGSARFVMLNDIKLINNELYKKNIDRHYASLFADGDDQFVMIGGDAWQKRRKIALNAFKFNSTQVNQGYFNILSTHMFPKIDKYHNKLYTTLRDDLKYLVFSLIYSTSFGHKAKLPAQNDSIMKQYFKSSEIGNAYFIEIFNSGFLYGVKLANWLNANVFNRLKPYKAASDIVAKWIEKYEQIAVEPTDEKSQNYYVENMLNHVKHNRLSRREMLRDSFSMFSGGLDTTVLTLEQGILYLIKHQDIQERLYGELFEHQQKCGAFSLKYINQLHVLRAFVQELLRNIKHLSNSVPRYVSKDIEIGGYTVPKGWFIMANHYYINHCDKHWKKPNEFYIDHFLDENNCFKQNEHMISFGVG
eukprot:532539_1